jgi:hypothetical protein
MRGDGAVPPDKAGEDLRPADIDADYVGIHGRRLP